MSGGIFMCVKDHFWIRREIESNGKCFHIVCNYQIKPADSQQINYILLIMKDSMSHGMEFHQ